MYDPKSRMKYPSDEKSVKCYADLQLGLLDYLVVSSISRLTLNRIETQIEALSLNTTPLTLTEEIKRE